MNLRNLQKRLPNKKKTIAINYLQVDLYIKYTHRLEQTGRQEFYHIYDKRSGSNKSSVENIGGSNKRSFMNRCHSNKSSASKIDDSNIRYIGNIDGSDKRSSGKSDGLN